MKQRFLATASLVGALSLLSGCIETTVSGRVLADGVEGAWVCIDSNGDLQCDDTEPGGPVQADGTYLFQRPTLLPMHTANLIVQVPAQASDTALAAPAQPSAFILAAPARDAGVVVTGLSTLLAMHRPTAGEVEGEDLALIESTLKRTLRLPDSVSLLADPGEEGAWPGLAKLDGVIVAALHQGAQAHLKAAAGAEAQSGASTRAAAEVLAPILGRYTVAETGQLLHTVSARTLVRETVAAFAPSTCVTSPPPMIVIDTEGGAPILDKENYVQAQLTMGATADFPQALNLSTRIRGRGNSTWSLEKKPYRLKFDNKSKVLGMTSDKDWALLANHTDKTMLRNAVALCLGRVMGMDYTPSAHHVELSLNNEYLGLYQLVEHVKVADHRVNIGAAATGPDDPVAGFLLEIDARLDETHWFYGYKGMPYTVKSDVLDPAQVDHIRAVVKAMEAALFGEHYRDSATGYAAHLDVEALVDFYLINEYLRNNDAFYSSTYVTRERGGKLKFGPLWDFDLAAGNVKFFDNRSATGWWLRNPDHYYGVYIRRLVSDPVFEQHVQARWQHLKQHLPALQAYIRQSADTLQASQARNFQRWDVLNTAISPSPLALGSYEAEVSHLQDWLAQRAEWMDVQLSPASASAPAPASSPASSF